MLEPRRAPVRPRVISPVSGETLLLEDEILALLERGESGIVWLVGGPGFGKTTARSHLLAALPNSDRLILHDDDCSVPHEWGKLHVGCGIPGTAPKNARAVYELAAWTEDEIIEYLLTTNSERCASVVRRCKATSDSSFLRGIPELWRHVLDVLAADENAATPKEALRRVIASRLPDGIARELASSWCLAILLGNAEVATKYRARLEKVCDFPYLLRLLWHVPVLLVLAADGISDQLGTSEPCEFLKYPLSRELIDQIAEGIRANERALDRLKDLLTASRRVLHPMAASLLHATRTGWRPELQRKSGWRKVLVGEKLIVPLLREAWLAGAAWPGISLPNVDLTRTDLSNADLSNSHFDDGEARLSNLTGAKLAGASLLRFCGDESILAQADFSYVRASGSSFDSADVRGARFEGALLNDSSFRDAKLTNASFVRANLSGAALTNAEIEGADFSQAELARAFLTGLSLRLGEFRQCSFHQAQMNSCDLEGMTLPGANFQEADLKGALLTGTVMPRADFRGANLVNTGLAEVDWEQVNLRDADLRGASFHMGSSRSGLVDSTIASFGSRTGFYTDDYNEQDFKTPEEIRKANLRGSDLRGANIDGVDFYLVDLRDAKYDAAQEQHFRSCGAILESRVE